MGSHQAVNVAARARRRWLHGPWMSPGPFTPTPGGAHAYGCPLGPRPPPPPRPCHYEVLLLESVNVAALWLAVTCVWYTRGLVAAHASRGLPCVSLPRVSIPNFCAWTGATSVMNPPWWCFPSACCVRPKLPAGMLHPMPAPVGGVGWFLFLLGEQIAESEQQGCEVRRERRGSASLFSSSDQFV